MQILQRKSPLDVNEGVVPMREPYDNTTGILSDSRVTNEHIGQAVREDAKSHPTKHAEILRSAATISAMESAKAQKDRA